LEKEKAKGGREVQRPPNNVVVVFLFEKGTDRRREGKREAVDRCDMAVNFLFEKGTDQRREGKREAADGCYGRLPSWKRKRPKEGGSIVGLIGKQNNPK